MDGPGQPRLRIVLVGKTGVGKSATGNTLLGRNVFESKLSSSSVTSECEKGTADFGGQTLAVVDTPPLFDTSKDEGAVRREIARCVSFASPGPHVFLVVLKPGRFTLEEKETVKIIQKMFGEKAGCYSMTLFTHGDVLRRESKRIEDLISENSALYGFVTQCRGGYHVFNNRDRNPLQVRELLEKIRFMVAINDGSCFTNQMFRETERLIEEETQQLQRRNPQMGPKDARRQAEEENHFHQVVRRGSLGAKKSVGSAMTSLLNAFYKAVSESVEGNQCSIQ